MREPYEGKLSRTVLRGEEGREPLALPGTYHEFSSRISVFQGVLDEIGE